MSDQDRVPLYDSFSADYDVMVDWPARLQREWPFFEATFGQVPVPPSGPAERQRVLDVGCGTGHHAMYFARKGRQVVGADPSAAMLERAEQLAQGLAGATFVRAGFGQLRAHVDGVFEAVTCLGNTLPHVLDRPSLFRALEDMADVLRPGGRLVVQQLNYDRVCAMRQRFLGLSAGQSGGEEVLFFRFYDFEDPLVTFNVARLRREPGGQWSFSVDATRLRPILQRELVELLLLAGFERPECYGGYDRVPFDPAKSNDLVVVASKRAQVKPRS